MYIRFAGIVSVYIFNPYNNANVIRVQNFVDIAYVVYGLQKHRLANEVELWSKTRLEIGCQSA